LNRPPRRVHWDAGRVKRAMLSSCFSMGVLLTKPHRSFGRLTVPRSRLAQQLRQLGDIQHNPSLILPFCAACHFQQKAVRWFCAVHYDLVVRQMFAKDSKQKLWLFVLYLFDPKFLKMAPGTHNVATNQINRSHCADRTRW
jgi:hypothetical protein